ncbi:MAG: 1-(5-phosphoribosyl)-5-[(5-phosphoribosylamino)methylideneamino]imidazole-4-carboxamide isomerase [Rickettsiales bacterium]
MESVTFDLYPAIDIKNGQCVRLTRGDMGSAVVFSDNPADQAMRFQAQGAVKLHVVDLDGACQGEKVNGKAVEAVISATKLDMQLGGGVRTMDDVSYWLDKGVSRVILGTAAVKNPALVEAAATRYPGRIMLGVDARGGKAAVEGWKENTERSVIDILSHFSHLPIASAIYTDVGRDGAMQGPDLEGTVEIARRSPFPIILSGGVASYDDVKAAFGLAKDGVVGAISGRAIYDGAIDVAEALRRIETWRLHA